MITFLPALCRNKDVPICIVSGEARLGKLCHTKTATCVALTEVIREDLKAFDTLKKNFTANTTRTSPSEKSEVVVLWVSRISCNFIAKTSP